MISDVDEPDQFFASLPAHQATSLVLLDQFRQLTFNENLIVDPDIPEALHDYRIAVRKTRALLARLQKIMPEPSLTRFRKNFAELMDMTGALRDLQACQTTMMSMDPDGQLSGNSVPGRLYRYIQQQSARERKRLIKYFASRKYIKLKDDWHVCLQGMAMVGDSSRAKAEVSVFAQKAIRQADRNSIRQADKAGVRVSSSALHKLRKQCKELRYLLEVFSDLIPPEPRIAMCKLLKKVQNKLGKIQDLQVLHLLVRGYADRFEDKLDRQQRKLLKQLLKEIKTEKRELKMDSTQLVRKYPQHSEKNILANYQGNNKMSAPPERPMHIGLTTKSKNLDSRFRGNDGSHLIQTPPATRRPVYDYQCQH